MSEKLTLADCFKYPNVKIREIGVVNYDEFQDLEEWIRLDKYCNNAKPSFKGIPLSDCQLVLRSKDQLTEKEKLEIDKIIVNDNRVFWYLDTTLIQNKQARIADYLRSVGIDVDGFIESGKAVKE